MSIKIIKYIGKNLYKTHILKGRKRYIVFLARYYLRKRKIDDLIRFFNSTPLREKILKTAPFIEQATRGFFYKNSTYAQRVTLIKNHINYCEKFLRDEVLEMLYINGKTLRLWEESYQDKMLSLELLFNAGQRKEGCLALSLFLWDADKTNAHSLYQIIFWFAPSQEDGLPSLWIGALQGSPKASDIIKDLTKAFFGLRTKNLIFYGIQNIAKLFHCSHIYAITNYGHYAMNHIRMDRKLKTSLDEFWQECEGHISKDRRFYDIPVEETRKSAEELKSQKRAQYKRRFAKMDDIAASIAINLNFYTKYQITAST